MSPTVAFVLQVIPSKTNINLKISSTLHISIPSRYRTKRHQHTLVFFNVSGENLSEKEQGKPNYLRFELLSIGRVGREVFKVFLNYLSTRKFS